MDPITLGILLISSLAGGAATYAASHDAQERARIDQDKRDEAARKFALEQQAHEEWYNSPAQQAIRLKEAGFNPASFLGKGGDTNAISWAPSPATTDTSSIDAVATTIGMFSNLKSLLDKGSESQNEMLAMRREMLDLRAEAQAERSALNAERLEQMKADNKLTLAKIEASTKLDQLIEDAKKGKVSKESAFSTVISLLKQFLLGKSNEIGK